MTIDNKLIDDKLIDSLLKDYKKPEDLIGENGLLKHLTKRLCGAGDGGGTDRARWV